MRTRERDDVSRGEAQEWCRKHDHWVIAKQQRNSQDLWIGVLRDLLGTSDLVVSFDESAVDKRGAGADERDEVRRVDRAPPGLC